MQRIFSIKIQRNLKEDSVEYYYFNIPENVKKVPRNVQKDPREGLRRFLEIFEKIPGNVQ